MAVLVSTTTTPIEAEFVKDLTRHRPELAEPFRIALPAARAAVLARLWRGLCLDMLPRVAARRGGSARNVLTLVDGRRLDGPADIGGFTRPPADLSVGLDDRRFTHPVELLAALGWPEAACLTAEVAHSVAGVALARADTAGPARAFADQTPEEHEQSVVDGHPLHPCCRNRTGFTAMDHLAYGPEHGPVVALELLAVRPERCLVRGEWPAELRTADRLLLPVHPWQSAHVLPRHDLALDVRGALPARPLIALRTLALVDLPWHVKTALSTQLTSATRDISGGSIRSSTVVSAFLAEVVGRLGGGMRIQPTRAAAAVLVDGEPHPDLAVVLRDRPAGGGTVLPVAALTARPRDGGCPPVCALAADDPIAWLAEFAATAVPPLLTLLAWGIALEAHEQNLLVGLVAGRPRGLVYRDLADIRLDAARLQVAGLTAPTLPGRMLADAPQLRGKLFATFVATTLTGLVRTLAEHAPERGLWDAVRAQIRRAGPDTPAGRSDRHALLTEPIPAKPLTLMRLDPATTAWAYQANPFGS